jgi:hypothetical protein
MIVLKSKNQIRVDVLNPNIERTVFMRVASVETSFTMDKVSINHQYYYQDDDGLMKLVHAKEEEIPLSMYDQMVLSIPSELNNLKSESYLRSILIGGLMIIDMNYAAGKSIFGSSSQDWEIYTVPDEDKNLHTTQIMKI